MLILEVYLSLAIVSAINVACHLPIAQITLAMQSKSMCRRKGRGSKRKIHSRAPLIVRIFRVNLEFFFSLLFFLVDGWPWFLGQVIVNNVYFNKKMMYVTMGLGSHSHLGD